MQETENAGRAAEATRQADGGWRGGDEESRAGGRARRGAGQGGVKADQQFAAALQDARQSPLLIAAHLHQGRPFMAQPSGQSDAAKLVGGAAWLVRLAAVLASAASFPATASSADICKAVALRDVAAIENPEAVISRGSYDEAITYYNVNKQTKMTSFCSHGGYCYPTHVFVNGQNRKRSGW